MSHTSQHQHQSNGDKSKNYYKCFKRLIKRFPFRAYDVTLVEKIDCLANGEIIFACTSVDTPKVPKVSGKNRHQIKVNIRF